MVLPVQPLLMAAPNNTQQFSAEQIVKNGKSVERQVLRAGLPLEYVIGDLKFYDDVVDSAVQPELTVIALPVQPLPQRAFRLPRLTK